MRSQDVEAEITLHAEAGRQTAARSGYRSALEVRDGYLTSSVRMFPWILAGVLGTAAALNANGAGPRRPVPTDVPPGLDGVAAVAAGWMHVLALKSNGTVVAWGSNYSGQTNVPAGLSHVTAIGAGLAHSLAVTSDGRVVAWG